MECLNPLTIHVPVYDSVSSKPFYRATLVPCGKCPCCICSDAQSWRTRLQITHENSDNAYFVTLTYDEASLPFESCTDSLGQLHIVSPVCKRDVQNFLKRLREKIGYKRLRYFFVSEYGPTTLRPHYHGILFNLPKFGEDNTKQLVEVTKLIQSVWSSGLITIDSVTFGRISYVTKYVSCKTYLPEWYPKPFRLMSKGLGIEYLNNTRLIEWHRQRLECYVPQGQFKTKMPRYLKDKIFDDDMKLQLREKVDVFRKERLEEAIQNAADFGYEYYVDYLNSRADTFMRKFKKQNVKKRKDI